MDGFALEILIMFWSWLGCFVAGPPDFCVICLYIYNRFIEVFKLQIVRRGHVHCCNVDWSCTVSFPPEVTSTCPAAVNDNYFYIVVMTGAGQALCSCATPFRP